MKALVRSKTFWLNVLGGVAAYGHVLPMSPEALGYVMIAANIGMRILTKGPVYVLRKAATAD